METQRYETVRKTRLSPNIARRLFDMRIFTSVYLLFYALSVPAWFASLFPHIIYNPSLWTITLIYLLTIATWAIVGYAIDRYSVTANRRRGRS
jgi:hypothetical protein